MIIDVFPHIVPPKYLKALNKKAPSNVFVTKVMASSPTLTDLDIRFRIMDRYEGLVQVLTLGAPTLETVVGPKDAVELARIANDEMAELVSKYPERFISAVASLPVNDMDATLKEVDRAINELRFRGIQIPSDINGKPLDSPELAPLYEKMAYYNLPMLIHPKRPSQAPDYPNEDASKYSVFLVFGWPYDSTVAMTRLVFSGVFEKYPNLKVLTHHCGAMVPFFAHRIAAAYDTQEMRWGYRYEHNLTRRPLDYFRMFYADTAVSGSTPALMCGYEFFGADRLLFGTDMPYDSQIGDRYTRDTILSIKEMEIPDSEKKKIFEDNAKVLFRLPL
jgi:aminocarboxymuconate-semialdehyde decarboxylase